ncbi:MAG: HAD-IIIA family hydrolase [Chitinophagales bacterium]|nr:HAD-IIIA family hydrolase [Chitinophagales bacterium]
MQKKSSILEDMETGEIKFLVLDVDGTLTDGGIYITEKGDEIKKFNTKDGMGIKNLLKAGVEVGFISASISKKIVHHRAAMLGVRYCYVGNGDKSEVLSQWLDELDLSFKEVAFIGDDINDAVIMQEVGLSAAPSDALSEVRSIANIVLEKKGGQGCVREFIDRVFVNRLLLSNEE